VKPHVVRNWVLAVLALVVWTILIGGHDSSLPASVR
jgi:hypothetical protein